MNYEIFKNVLLILYENKRFLSTFSSEELQEILFIFKKENKLERIKLLLQDTQKYVKGIISVTYLNNFF